jgi:hypothetical protein
MEEKEKRTSNQNRALHLLFRLWAEALNDAGLDMKKTLKESVEIPWDEHTIKRDLWKPIQKAVLHKDSTTKLLKDKEIDEVYDVLNRHLGEKFGIYVPFPSLERVMEEEEKKLKKFYEKFK